MAMRSRNNRKRAVRASRAYYYSRLADLALQAFEQAVERCAGYASTPGLGSLRTLHMAE